MHFKKRKNLQSQKGFTIVELVVYISLTSVMLLAIASFSKMILEARTRNGVISEVEQQGAQVAQIISQTIRNAENISAPLAGSSSSSLSLSMANAIQNPTVFSTNGNAISMQEGGGSQVKLSNSHVTVQNLFFYNLSRANTPGIVKFSFVLSHNNRPGKPEYNYSKTFYSSASLR